MIDRTAYAAQWSGGSSEESVSRLANIDELVNAARQYDELAGEELSLQGFLEQTALVSDTDSLEEDSGRVTLMTLHAAKGLEFPIVFIVGVEENLIPHARSLRSEDNREIEEERRLLFVGMTRAQERLYLTSTQVRSMHGKSLPTISSMFLRELEFEPVDLSGPAFDFSDSWEGDEDFDDEPDMLFEDADPPPVKKSSPKLMTGADLLGGKGNGVELPQGFAIGSAVRHPRYGAGTVIDVGGFGARRTVTVMFDDDRKETFVASKAPLQPIG